MKTITMAAAVAAFRAGNNAGNGYAPYADVPGDDTAESAVAAAQADGGEVILRAETSDDVTVLRMADGALLAIGAMANGRGAWAVPVS